MFTRYHYGTKFACCDVSNVIYHKFLHMSLSIHTVEKTIRHVRSVDRCICYTLIFMPPTSKKLRGHIGLGLSVRPSVCPSVCP